MGAVPSPSASCMGHCQRGSMTPHGRAGPASQPRGTSASCGGSSPPPRLVPASLLRISTSLFACCSSRVSVPRWALRYSTCLAHSKMHSVLAVYGCVMNDHRFNSFMQHTCIITCFWGQDGVQAHSLAGPSAPGLIGCS